MEYEDDSFEHRWRTARYWDASLSSFPGLRLHDLEEGRGWDQKSKEEFEKKGEEYLEEDGAVLNPRLYVPLRFFESLIKFHEGSLDLSGRHTSRYIRLVEKFKLLGVDYMSLYAQCTPFTYTEPDFRGEPTVYQDYKFEDETLWPAFAKKWGISKWWDCSNFFSWINRVVNTLSKHPEPVLQLVCLHHLPVELISRIFHFTSLEDARLLSSTSHQMRSIGLQDIFWVRRLGLLEKFDGDPRTPYSDAQMNELLLKGRETLLSTIDFLTSRGDLIKAMEKLILVDGIKRSYLFPRSVVHYVDSATEMADFYAPVQRGFESVLRTASTLSELRFTSLTILPTYVHSILCMPALHTVSFHICSAPAELVDLVVAGELPKVTTVRNLSVYMDIEEDIEEGSMSWFLIPLFTGLHNMTIISTQNIALPPGIIVDRLNHFQDVERFTLHQFSPQGLPLLTNWISISAQFLGFIPLTHFKLHSPWPMDDFDLFEFLAILRHAPSLQTLSIDGILYAEPDLLDRIAESAPKLLSLWLVKRHNDRQKETKSCPWPQATSRYAEKLRLFPRLQHFGWNDVIPSLVPSTSIMLNFEDGFPEPEWPGCWERGRLVESYFLDGYLTSALFALYCPTLEAVCWLDDRSEEIDFIARNSDATMDFEAARKYRDYERSYELMRKWNPSMWDGGWPRIVPRGAIADWSL